MDPERRFRQALLLAAVGLPIVLVWLAVRWLLRLAGLLAPPAADPDRDD